MKTTISGIIAALASFFALIAVAPPELQNQIPQLFPEHYRGQLVILFGVIAFLSKAYQSNNTQDAKPLPLDTTNVVGIKGLNSSSGAFSQPIEPTPETPKP